MSFLHRAGGYLNAMCHPGWGKTTDHVIELLTLPALAAAVNERYPDQNAKCKIFLDELHISLEQSCLLSQITVGQANNKARNKNRIGRITSSKVGAVLQKIDNKPKV